jgi:hypothetical protein
MHYRLQFSVQPWNQAMHLLRVSPATQNHEHMVTHGPHPLHCTLAKQAGCSSNATDINSGDTLSKSQLNTSYSVKNGVFWDVTPWKPKILQLLCSFL